MKIETKSLLSNGAALRWAVLRCFKSESALRQMGVTPSAVLDASDGVYFTLFPEQEESYRVDGFYPCSDMGLSWELFSQFRGEKENVIIDSMRTPVVNTRIVMDDHRPKEFIPAARRHESPSRIAVNAPTIPQALMLAMVVSYFGGTIEIPDELLELNNDD